MFAAALILAAAAPAPQDVYGLWLTEAGSAHVEIADCGDGTPCGELVWVDPESGALDHDANNPDPAMTERALIGIRLLGDFEAHENGWRRGEIYDPESGRTYRSMIRRKDADALEVKGCFGPICRSQTWTPAERAASD